jgi:hypothetical protein
VSDRGTWNFSSLAARLGYKAGIEPPVPFSAQPVILAGDTRDLMPPYLGPSAIVGGDGLSDEGFWGTFELYSRAAGGCIVDHLGVWFSCGGDPAFPSDGAWIAIQDAAVVFNTEVICQPQVMVAPFVSTAKIGNRLHAVDYTPFPWTTPVHGLSILTPLVAGSGGNRFFTNHGTMLEAPIFVPMGKRLVITAITSFNTIYVGCRVREFPAERTP